ncbi:hypothetical protein [Gordonia sp. (in: high G+C Gram-positive bacteria)]|uniref:hypothetical protein n=1 Tax=Gordonia sp. (in: high G+C Gram-positive bacteria) TaxID=84139 RepID=UPI003C78AE42
MTTAMFARLDELGTAAAAAFDVADRRYRDRLNALTATVPQRQEPARIRRLRARLEADSDAASTVVPQLLLPANLDAARPRIRRR